MLQEEAHSHPILANWVAYDGMTRRYNRALPDRINTGVVLSADVHQSKLFYGMLIFPKFAIVEPGKDVSFKKSLRILEKVC